MTTVMTRLSPADKLLMAREVAFREFGALIRALVTERILPRNLHWALYKMQPYQATTDKLPAIADALQQLPGLEERYRFALELRQRRAVILPLLVDYRDQAPAELREDVSYVLRVSPGMADDRTSLLAYRVTFSLVEVWLLGRFCQVEAQREFAAASRHGNGVPASCRSLGCSPPHASKRVHDTARAQYAPKKGQNGKKR